jgi:hypothetical protein
MGYLFQIVYHISNKYFFQKPIPSESNQVFALQRASAAFDGSDKIRQKNNISTPQPQKEKWIPPDPSEVKISSKRMMA